MNKKKEQKNPNSGGINKPMKVYEQRGSANCFHVPHSKQMDTRALGYDNKALSVNSEFIFQQEDFKKKTKGYDALTVEIEKRGRPADNQEEIFIKVPEKDKTFEQIKKEKMKSDAKKREALNKKLYKDRLKTKWDRGW
jgi:hypothetical protein